MPIHLLLSGLRRLAAVLPLVPLAAAALPQLPDGLYAEITTPRGTITCELDYVHAPLTVANFVGLAEGTLGPQPRKPFFEGLTFHRVVPGFVVQGGDPKGTGEGGPGYTFPDEFSPKLGHDATGVLSMANDGLDTNGSQFFITLSPVVRLNYLYSVFGRTVRGLEVLPSIVQGDVMHVRILRLGDAAHAFKADEATFAALSAKAARFTDAPQPGPSAPFDDPDKLLPVDPPRAQTLNFKLGNFHRATGIRIDARIFAKFVPAGTGDSPDRFVGTLATSLGLADQAILAVYFADRDEWFLHVGKALAPRFIGLSKPVQHGDDEARLQGAIQGVLSEAREREAQYLALYKKTLPNFLQIPGSKIKASIDAMLDGLMAQVSL